jgi:hypothetical protein
MYVPTYCTFRPVLQLVGGGGFPFLGHLRPANWLTETAPVLRRIWQQHPDVQLLERVLVTGAELAYRLMEPGLWELRNVDPHVFGPGAFTQPLLAAVRHLTGSTRLQMQALDSSPSLHLQLTKPGCRKSRQCFRAPTYYTPCRIIPVGALRVPAYVVAFAGGGAALR